MKNSLIILFSLGTIGCAHWYSEDRSTLQVQVLTDQPLPNDKCEKLNPIEGLSYWDTTLAFIDLKKKAASQSATHVVLEESDSGFCRQIYRGYAYRCRS